MSQANELLDSLTNDELAAYTVDPTTEEHIIVDGARRVTVPESLKRIAVQFDHNIETVTFDCPRYWDGIDMSVMKIFINYLRPDGRAGSSLAENVYIDESDDTIMHFTWTILGDVTQIKGNLSFLICIKQSNDDGFEENHWNSELNTEMYISEGLECEEPVTTMYPAIITQLLVRMEEVNEIASGGAGKKTVEGGEIFNDYENNIATGEDSHSEGGKTEATGAFSHAQNRKAKATGRHAHAQNYDTLAQGEASSASGVQSKVFQRGGHVEGIQCISGDETQDSSVDNPAHSEGIHSKSIGFASHAENSSEALGDQSHSEGFAKVKGELSHGENGATVNGVYSHGEGGAVVNGDFAHGEGDDTETDGYAAHSEGQGTKAKGQAAHAGGYYTEANHMGSDATGGYTKTGRNFQKVGGTYNEVSEDALFVIGNGTSEDDRKNAFEVKEDGSAVLQTQGVTDDSVVTKAYVDNAFDIYDQSKQKNYELIATIKVAPDENGNLPTSIVFTQDNNGNPFELTDFYLSAVVGATDGSSAKIALTINNKQVFGNTNLGISTDLRQWWLNYMNFGAKGSMAIAPSWTVGGKAHATAGNTNISGFAGGVLPPLFSDYLPVTKINFYIMSGTNKTFIEGSEFKLYGVRK